MTAIATVILAGAAMTANAQRGYAHVGIAAHARFFVPGPRVFIPGPAIIPAPVIVAGPECYPAPVIVRDRFIYHDRPMVVRRYGRW
jgi:hypothetical protein